MIRQGQFVQNEIAEVTWNPGDVPVSQRFDDPYFSLENGLAETRYVFLQGNQLPDRFKGDFAVAELGFGTGLNFLCTLASWRRAAVKGHLTFTSFEAYPMARADMTKALEAFEEIAELRPLLINKWDVSGGIFQIADDVTLQVIVGDARQTLPAWSGASDAWFLDGFSPAKNPELWAEDLMKAVAEHTRPGGTCATYSAAGFVRRGLQSAGFNVVRVSGYGRKRHMTCGVLPK